MWSHLLSGFEKQAIEKLSRRPGLAAKLLSTWASLPADSVHTPHSLTAMAQLGVTEERGAAEVFMDAAGAGLLSKRADAFVPTLVGYPAFSRLALALQTVDFYMRSIHRDESLARVVLTKPPKPSALESQLDSLGWRIGDLEATTAAFFGMIQRAKHRVIVMTPFFDPKGALWLKQLFQRVAPGVSRCLVLRSLEDSTRPDYPTGYPAIADWLKAENIALYNYSIPRSSGLGRETFHAKVVLCDDGLAYVGSSNLNAASLEHSMEMGVAIEGKAARDVALVLEAVLAAATPMAWS